jgi:predicted permease
MKHFLESVVQDVRQAVRSLARARGVSLVAVPTLALAIGATTALFGFADALLLRPLPAREPDRLLALFQESTAEPGSYSSFSYPGYLDLRAAGGPGALAEAAAYADVEVRLGEGPEAGPAGAALVSGNYFAVLGVRPVLGRTFLPEEDRAPGAHAVVMLAEALWRDRFGSDPGVLGSTVAVNGRPFTVIGVAPRSTPAPHLASDPQLWVPLAMYGAVHRFAQAGERGAHWLRVVGRMADGMTAAGAAEELRAFARRQAEAHPEAHGEWTIAALPLGQARTGPPGWSPLPRLATLLAAMVALLLLLACASVANLLLARGVAREREAAIRRALGATRGRLALHSLAEGLVLAAAGGAAGVVLAAVGVRALPALGLGSGLPGLDVRLDPRVLGIALATTLAAGLMASVVPALRAAGAGVPRGPAVSAMAIGGGRRRMPLQQVLVAVQVGVSFVLLVGAGLTLRTLWELHAIPLGYEVSGLQAARLDAEDRWRPAGAAASGADGRAWDRVLERVRAEPGVVAAAAAHTAPFSPWRMARDFLAGGAAPGEVRERVNVDTNVVDGGYFATLAIPLVTGRSFAAGDLPGTPPVAIINRALAARLWPGQDPVGRHLFQPDPQDPDAAGTAVEVVGVVADGRYHRGWRSGGRGFVFLPLSQHPQESMTLLLRGAAPGVPAEAAVRRAVWEAQPGWTLAPVASVTSARAQAIAAERSNARLLTLFGVLAAIVTVIGIYGVVSFTVSRRTQEIGVRMALGARAAAISRQVLARSAVPLLVGAGGGWLAALALSRFVEGLLFGVQARDPATFAAVGAALVAIGLLAALVPARRAARIEPLAALRSD